MEAQTYIRGDTGCERNEHRARELSTGGFILEGFVHRIDKLRLVITGGVPSCYPSQEGRCPKESTLTTIMGELSSCSGRCKDDVEMMN